MSAPAIIQSLVNRFRDSRELYRSGRYNEAQLRQEFLNPLFETLGWDMYNRSNFAPQYREVIHEDSLEDEGSLKAPDYAFRIGTTRKFFVEAKKPAVDIRYAIHPAYQLRRYAWNAHLPLSILTDFEELAVYDCRTRPDPQDSAATGRVMLFTFEDYLTRWDELAQIFSKDAVWNGSFDRYAEGSKGKRGTTEVDAEFLKEIEQWRLLLARNIALRNFRSFASEKNPLPTPPPSAKRGLEGVVTGQSHGADNNSIVPGSASFTPSREGDEGGGGVGVIASEAKQSPESTTEKMETIWSKSVLGQETGTNRDGLSKQSHNLHRAERQLNYAVQTTIDRILFLRICEDRQIEPTDQLLQIAEGSDIYAQLLKLFQKADQKYNSGLFHFNKEKTQTSEPDTFTPTLQIDDKVLRQVIKSTYYPCPYMFNEIPVEILGQVYEQFLGSVIRLTPGGQAKVEEKPEVRKAGGVYYTPRYIVDYIVQNTLGRLLGDSCIESEDAVKPSLWGGEVQPQAGSVSVANGGEGGVGETIRSKPVLGQETGTNSRSNPVLGQPTNASGVGVLRNTGTNNIGFTTPSLDCLRPAEGGGGGRGVTPAEALKLRVVDPACGSGSFLLGAYQYLLDWHLNYYLTHDPQSHTQGKNPPLVATDGGEYRLTTETKKCILTSTIHGVDIDAQAVEVTKLSLLLKLLEGETGQLTLGFERVLPDLGQNIRCGNSLIGWDYFQGQMFPDEEDIQRVNPFDWQRAFLHVFAEGGFDAVIGNPPWGADIHDLMKYFWELFPDSTKEKSDSFKLFIDQGIRILGNGGFFGMIVPSTVIQQSRYKDVRKIILDHSLDTVVNLGENVFARVVAPTCILILQNSVPSSDSRVASIDIRKELFKEEALSNPDTRLKIYAYKNIFKEDNFSLLPEDAFLEENSTFGSRKSIHFKDAGINYQRVNVGLREKGKSDLSLRLLYEGEKKNESDEMYWKGEDINKYWIADTTNRFCRTNYRDFIKHNEVVHLNENIFSLAPKILIRQTADRVIATLDEKGVWFGRSILSMYCDDSEQHNIRYFLGLLNSRLFTDFYQEMVKEKGRVFAQVKLTNLKKLPLRLINFDDDLEVLLHNRIVQLVDQITSLKKIEPRTPSETMQLSDYCHAIEKEIDAIVDKLYELDPVKKQL